MLLVIVELKRHSQYDFSRYVEACTIGRDASYLPQLDLFFSVVTTPRLHILVVNVGGWKHFLVHRPQNMVFDLVLHPCHLRCPTLHVAEPEYFRHPHSLLNIRSYHSLTP